MKKKESKLDLNSLSDSLDTALKNETKESLTEWLENERSYSKEEVLQILPRVTDNYDLKMDIRMTPEMQNEWFSRLRKKLLWKHLKKE